HSFCRATEQSVHGLSGVLSANVPECEVDSADRHDRHTFAAVEQRRAVHLIPKQLGVQRVDPDQKILQVMLYDVCARAAAASETVASDALLCLDFDNQGAGELSERTEPAPTSGVVVGSELRRRIAEEAADFDGISFDGSDRKALI